MLNPSKSFLIFGFGGFDNRSFTSNSDCYRRIMIAIQSAGTSNIVQHLFSSYNYEFD